MNKKADFLTVENLTKRFDKKNISISFSVKKGGALALLGPSGCGKTTILKMIAGLLVPDSGSVFLDGKDITEIPAGKRKIGMVFQDYALFPHLSVEDNIAYGLVSHGMSKRNARAEAGKWILNFNLSGLEKRKPDLLSGGEKQRVSLARSLAVHPALILFDEPLSALDTELRLRLRKELRENRSLLGYTAVYVTHDKEEAEELADGIIEV
ncbi:ABC transporter ATP-binding protein [Treponema pedis]|uniref:Thiamine ABC transporter ATP-binding protein n=1 Tax=Treponema pedis str. T A4 TaxID=1291379 RepID=S6A7W6_9SPIR|nr:ABC transporter ATP-binding protein [Treponema pedis]AGT42799.1 thiamine ABC transporter ATP-binding protein [Treponema pedis str. T A4]QSI03671.1 ATP-binding cassette domain-containing protein [Treponema pedis]